MSLKGKTVLITRPEAQAKILFELVEQQQATPLLLPLLSIQTLESEKLDNVLSDIQDYDYVIFVSRNAADICLGYLQNKKVSLAEQQCLAIGAATLRALKEYGCDTKQPALEYATSEILLTQDLLSQTQIDGKSILIVRGQGGRETLGDELKNRGARVNYSEVYARKKVAYSLAQKREIIITEPDVVILTSNEGINAYYELFHELEKSMIENKSLVVLSERNKAYAENLGFFGVIKVAEQTSDHGLLDACVKHFN